MAVDKKISQLASGAPAQAGDEYVVARSGANYKLTLTNIAASMPATTITSGNLTFSSTAQRITGDFSNATPVNRPMFQSSTTNGYTVVRAIPNGTSQYAEIGLGNNSDATAATSTFFMSLSATEARIASSQANTGTLLPLTFQVGGSERVRIDTSGNLGVGTSTASFKITNNFDAPATWGNNANNFIEMWQNSGTNALGVAMGDDSIASFTTNNGYNLVFATDGTERMRIATSTGNVGIGTTSPGTKLDVLSGTNAGIRVSDGTYTGIMYPSGLGGIAVGTTSNHPYLILTNNTERMRIDSSGNVGIGGAADAPYKVHIRGTLPTSSNASVALSTWGTSPSGTTNLYRSFESYPSTAAGSYTLSSLQHYWAGQNVIGASSTLTNQYGFFAESTLTGATNNYGFYSNIASGSNRWNFYAAGTANNHFNGDVFIGTTSTAGSVNVPIYVRGGGVTWQLGPDASGNFIVYNNNDTGVYVTSGNTSWTANSDERIKTDLVPIADALSKVSSLRTVTGRYIKDAVGTSRSFLIAQDVQAVFPEAVDVPKKESDPLGLRYTDVVPLLIAAIKELSAKVAALEAK